MISVIIPHYNNQDVIKRSINSVLKQSFQGFEIIVVDDFSENIDKLEAIIYNINDSRIILVKHTENRNGSSARNTGVANAKGEYIAFLDADDEWIESHLEKSFLTAKKNNSKFVYCRSNVITNDHELILPFFGKNKDTSIADFLFIKGEAIYTPTFFIHKSVFEKVKFNEKIIRHQDFDYLLRYESIFNDFEFSNHIGVIVHWENNSVLTKGETWKFSLKWIKSKELNKKEKDNFIAQFVLYKILKEDKIKAIKIFISERINPFNLTKRKIYNLSKLFIS